MNFTDLNRNHKLGIYSVLRKDISRELSHRQSVNDKKFAETKISSSSVRGLLIHKSVLLFSVSGVGQMRLSTW